MEPTNQLKTSSQTLYVIVGILCLLIFAGLICWQYQKPERKSDATENNQAAPSDQSNTADQVEQPPLSNSERLYQQATGKLDEKKYSEAIKFLDQAIAEDPYEPQYYSEKSEAQYNLGEKQAAIDTLKQGSSVNPDSDLLKSKIDVLSKDQFSNPNIDTPRE